MRWAVVGLVAAHAAVLLGHDVAHRDLGVGLVIWQWAYVYAVIVAGPLVAAVLVFTRNQRLGFWLLAASMLGAFLFGVYHHHIAISPDHVDHLPAGESQGLFRGTAGLMGLIEAGGVALGIWALRRGQSLR